MKQDLNASPKLPKFAHRVTHAFRGFSTRNTNTSATPAQASERPLQHEHRLFPVCLSFYSLARGCNISLRITTLLIYTVMMI